MCVGPLDDPTIRFMATILDEDLKRFPLKSGAIARSVYTNASLSELQASTEKVVSDDASTKLTRT